MKSANQTTSVRQDDADSLIGRVADEFLERLHRGERPDMREYIARHPEVESALREVLPALEVIGGLAASATHPGPQPTAGCDGSSALGRIGDFQIIREIGRGGMGIVYEAEQISLARRVALKVLPFAAAMDERHLQRFRNEAQAAAHLQHQNIVPVYAVGCERGVHYYAMQFVEGRTLGEMISELRELRADRAGTPARATDETSTRSAAFFRAASRLAIQAAEALEHAHQFGVVHRDIKPANLLVDARKNLWITDFGLAQIHADTRLTVTGDLLGTLRYMSPEQAMGKAVVIDHRTDLYSLGATLYELLTLRPVFDGADRQQLLRQIAFEEPGSPRHFNPAIPIELETIVLKCLAKNPDERFATARELADDLLRFQRDEPIHARRPTFAQRLVKWSRRHPAVVRSFIVILLIAVAALTISTISISRAKQQAEAREAETRAVIEFVENQIFAAARPKGQLGGLGHDVTLRQAIEAAVPFVGKSFPNQPLVEARLRMTLGTSFWSLGEPKMAIEQYQRARSIYTSEFGPDHLSALRAMNNLAVNYATLGLHDQALPLREEVLARRKATLGKDHPETLSSMNNLAVNYALLGRDAEALKLFDEVLVLRRSKFGTDHPDTLSSMHNLASCYTRVGRHDEALRLYEQTLVLRQARLGRDHPETLQTMSNIAVSYSSLARHDEALKIHEETLAVQKLRLGRDHPGTLMSMNSIATEYANLNRHQDAAALHEQTLALRKIKLGPDHPDTLISMCKLAASLIKLERNSEAEPLLLEACRIIEQRPQARPVLIEAAALLAELYEQSGKPDEAARWRAKLTQLTPAQPQTDTPPVN